MSTTAAVTHTPVVCKRINASHDFHAKSHSYRFECPTCGKSRRQNTNFLGSRYRLVCDGSAIVRVHRDEIEAKAWWVGPDYCGPDYPWTKDRLRAHGEGR